MLEKKNIINTIFVAAFPVYGIGSYISAAISPSAGYLISAAPFLCIITFYIVDLIYRGTFTIRVNGWYLLMVIFLFSTVASLLIALNKGLPETNPTLTLARSILLLVPFQAFVCVQLYNDDGAVLSRLTFKSFSLLLLLNLVGYFVFGINNALHSIEGRLNFPFLDGFYSGSCLIAIINLMLLYYFPEVKGDALKLAGWFTYFTLNLVLLFYINSRLTNLVFVLVFFLVVTHLIGRLKGIYLLSLFTIPILLSTGMLLYDVLRLPVFSAVLRRVDLIDVTTFNGRAFLWKDAIDWLLHDQRGLVFGNGYRGHYFLNLVSDVAELWNERDLHHLHLHSTSLEILVAQGLTGYAVFLMLFFRLFVFLRRNFVAKGSQAVFFGVAVFLLVIMQVDTFLYMESLGSIIFMLLFSFVVIRRTEGEAGRGGVSLQRKNQSSHEVAYSHTGL